MRRKQQSRRYADGDTGSRHRGLDLMIGPSPRALWTNPKQGGTEAGQGERGMGELFLFCQPWSWFEAAEAPHAPSPLSPAESPALGTTLPDWERGERKVAPRL